MPEKILDRIRRLNWVLTESTTGSLSYDQLSKILSEVINANVYLTDAAGSVLGTGYINAEDTSTEVDEKGGERIPEYHNDNFMKMNSTSANITGKQALDIMGDGYAMADKYHCIVPSFCGGDRLGTLIVTRYNRKFSEEYSPVRIRSRSGRTRDQEKSQSGRRKREETDICYPSGISHAFLFGEGSR